MRKTSHTISVSLAALAIAASSFALQPAQAQSATPSQTASAAYDDQTVHTFAQAASVVLNLRNHYYPRIRAAEIAKANEKANNLFAEMRSHMRAAIAKSGFTEDQYRAISSAAKADAILRHRINSFLKGAPPAQQHVQQVAPVTPQPAPAQQVVSAPTPTPEPEIVPTPVRETPPQTAALTPPADTGASERLKAELDKANAERDRYHKQQTVLQERVRALESRLSAVKAQDTALRSQLNKAKTSAQAQQQENQAQLGAMSEQVSALQNELADAQSRDANLREQLEAEKSAKEVKIAAFRNEIERLAGRLASAQQSLDGLAGNLTPRDSANGAPRQPTFQALQPLRTQPTSIDRVLERVEPQYAKQRELDEELTRIQKERAYREAERTRLQGEIAELSRELAATYQAMAELIGSPNSQTTASVNWNLTDGYYALDLSQETAQLFEVAPAQPVSAAAEGPAGMQFEPPAALGLGGAVDQPRAHSAAHGAELETHVTPTLRISMAPQLDIATFSAASIGTAANKSASAQQAAEGPINPRPNHQIVRDEDRFAPVRDLEIATDTATVSSAASASVSAGVQAYKASDFGRAYEIWSALAEAGSRSAQFHLGALYFEGRGTAIDLPRAYMWLRIAAKRGDSRALNMLSTVASHLNPDEINASEDLAREWLNKRSIELSQARQPREKRL